MINQCIPLTHIKKMELENKWKINNLKETFTNQKWIMKRMLEYSSRSIMQIKFDIILIILISSDKIRHNRFRLWRIKNIYRAKWTFSHQFSTNNNLIKNKGDWVEIINKPDLSRLVQEEQIPLEKIFMSILLP